MLYSEGFHGTDEQTARTIFESGFSSGPFDELHLASPDQTYLAHTHGQKNAERSGQRNYGIIRAMIPPSSLKWNRLGPAAIRLDTEDIDEVVITGLSIYTHDGDLVEGEPIEITNVW